ncbi:MAG: T9SS type A sorting domain-containing protein [Saprospiraceae bacterium]|nr:T9SS type A sorting domain-containing protein [Saprospiraceae bacterium]
MYADEQHDVIYLVGSANGQRTLIGYDGHQTVEYKSHPNLRQIAVGDNHILYKGVGRDTAYLFNLSEKRLYPLPALPEGEYYVGHSLFQNDTFVYAIGGETYRGHLSTYQLKDHYSTIIPHYRLDSLFYASSFDVGGGTGGKLLFTGRYILHQKGNGETIDAKNIRNLFPGSTTANVPFDKFYSKGYLYFIAQDREYGNQLFRYYLDETIFPDHEKKVNYALCPSLVDQKITLTSPITDDIQVHYEIYSIDGKLLQRGFSTYNEVDASGLANGLYIITLKVPDGDVSLKFVKM